jgi:hypothetical protein
VELLDTPNPPQPPHVEGHDLSDLVGPAVLARAILRLSVLGLANTPRVVATLHAEHLDSLELSVLVEIVDHPNALTLAVAAPATTTLGSIVIVELGLCYKMSLVAEIEQRQYMDLHAGESPGGDRPKEVHEIESAAALLDADLVHTGRRVEKDV